jgi:putative transposase
VKLIFEARENGARLIPTCEVVGISVRTYERWCKEGNVAEDRRPLAIRKSPTNKLTEEEYQSVLEIVISPEYVDLPPAQIVPSLADAGIYIAS